MKTIEKADEKRLIGAIERAISLTNQGMGPTDAITKIAREEKFSPPFIHRMVESFNKSKSVFRLKEASQDDRHQPFDLADADKVVSNVFTDVKPMEKAASETPSFNPRPQVNAVTLLRGAMEKTASSPKPSLKEQIETARVRASRLYKQAGVVQKVRAKLHTQTVQEKHAFEQSIERACELLLPMSDRQLRKVAQAMVNGYPQTGEKLIRIFAHKTRRNLPVLEKTAKAVVFPVQEPYITIGKVYEHAEKYASAESELAQFEKHAFDFGASFAANALANLAAQGDERLGESLQGVEKKKKVDPDELLDPVFFNRLRELDAKRALMQLVVNDPDLKDYKYSDIVRAYNTAVSSVPEAQGNPTILKTLLLKNLESSGIKDVFELSQEQQLAKNIAEAETFREKVRKENRPQAEEEPAKRQAITGTKAENTMAEKAKALRERAGKIVDDSFRKDKKEEKEDAGGAYRDEAMTILRGGKKKGPVRTGMLGRWPDHVQKNVKTRQVNPSRPPAKSVQDLEKALAEFHTLPEGEWSPGTREQLKYQFGYIQ